MVLYFVSSNKDNTLYVVFYLIKRLCHFT